MKFYRGSPGAARTYVEQDRSRADDYYLAEGSGVATRYTASPLTGVTPAGSLTGEAYEQWVAGYDPASGVAKGRLRTDAKALRFVEVVVNGPKTWSLAAALHPEIADALDAAQTRAAEQIIGWVAEHATTRVGPKGRQVQVPVSEVEAAVVRHYTSRAGDPHRHLHVQINARVLAEGAWRGLHSVGCATVSPRSTESATPRSPRTSSSAGCSPRTASPWTRPPVSWRAGGLRGPVQRPDRADQPEPRPLRGPVARREPRRRARA